MRDRCSNCAMPLPPEDAGQCPVCYRAPLAYEPAATRGWLWAVLLASLLTALFTGGAVMQALFPVEP